MSVENAGNSDFFYNAKGDRVSLERVPGSYAVRYRPGRRSDDASISEGCRRFLRNNSTHLSFIPNYQLQVYSSGLADAGAIRREVRSLNDESAVRFATPVFRRSQDPDDSVYVLNRFIVTFNQNVPPDEAERRISELNARYQVGLVERLSYTKPAVGFLLETPGGDGENGPVELAKRYYEALRGLVRYAIPDLVQKRAYREVESDVHDSRTRATRSSTSSWTYQNEQWHLRKAKVIEAWEQYTRGDAGIVIAISDDGVDMSHPEFSGKVVKQYDFASHAPDGNPKSVMDKHGTACAGVAVAKGINASGSAPDCKLMAVRFPEMLGVDDEARMFEWMANEGADVISCSWGPPDGTGAAYYLPDNVRDAIHSCVTFGRNGKGIPIFWAAGNGNESVSADGYAANKEVITIAASSENDTHSYYSDYGPEVDLCAPSSGNRNAGERRLLTTDRRGADGYNAGGSTTDGDMAGDYTNGFGGTSAAAPLAAGIAGLMLSVNPNLKWNHVRQILIETADKITGGSPGSVYDSNGHSNLFGFGRVNALRAVERAATFDTSTSGPSISGPATILRSNGPPAFSVELPAGKYYAIEVATRSELLYGAQHGSERNSTNFYATWQDAVAFHSDPTYRLPLAAWEGLKSAARLFYRFLINDSNTAWVNHSAVPADAQHDQAKVIQVVPYLLGPSYASRAAGPPEFQVGVPPGHYHAVEVATRPELFHKTDHGSERTNSNFYATWQETNFSSAPTLRLPTSAWNSLNSADRLYYRLWVSASATGWVDHKASPPDEQYAVARFIQLGDS